MLREDLKKRMEALNREEPDTGPAPAEPEPSELPAAPEPPAEPATPPPPHISLQDVAPGSEVEFGKGKLFLIQRNISEVVEDCDQFFADFDYIFERGAIEGFQPVGPDDAVEQLLNVDARRVLYLDIETAGLSSAPLFLIGVMHYVGKEFQVRQLFARDYSEEGPVIEYLNSVLREFDALVTFNGKSFDMPFIRDRALVAAVPFECNVLHLDLLHESRRRWKGHLPNHKLQTLETYICRRIRAGDIPGEKIPQAYHDFVRTGNAIDLRKILHHNVLDLLTMSQILVFICKGEELYV